MIARAIIESIVAQQTTKDDIIVLRDSFGSNINGCKAFVAALDEMLDDQSLHALNSAIMKNAITLNSESPNFLCRSSNEKIFADLLQLEAKRHKMQIKFDDNGNMKPLEPKDIPDAILDHYTTLQKHFYKDSQVI